MKFILAILLMFLSLNSHAQRYRLVADSLYDYDKGSFKLNKVIHYAYSGDKGSNATNDTLNYDTCIVYYYNRMLCNDTGQYHRIKYEKSSKPRLAEKIFHVRNALGHIDTTFHYKPVLRDTLNLASITVYNRTVDGQLYSKDVYGLVYRQVADEWINLGAQEEDTLIDGVWHYAKPQISVPVAQPKVSAGHQLTQKDSFEYTGDVLKYERKYYLFDGKEVEGNIEYLKLDDFNILSKCKEIKQYEQGRVVLWEKYNARYCYNIDYFKTTPYIRAEATYYKDSSLKSYSFYIVSDMDTILYDTANLMRDRYGRDSAKYFYTFLGCSSNPHLQHIYYDKEGNPARYVELASSEQYDSRNWQIFWLVKKSKIKYDNKGRLRASYSYHYDEGSSKVVRKSIHLNKYSKNGYLKEKAFFYSDGGRNKKPSNKNIYTYEAY